MLMATGQKSWSYAGYSGIALAGMVAPALYAFLAVQAISAPTATLGSAALCEKYSGLPDNFANEAHVGMVHINGGEFVMGTTLGYEEERQTVKTRVHGFWIDRTEVTVAEFAEFVKATGYVTEAEREGGAVVFRTPAPAQLEQHPYSWWQYHKAADWRHPTGIGSSAVANYPVTMVTLADALAYAKWLGRDLPTEAEWEYAAKAGRQDTGMEKEPRDELGMPLANFWQGDFPLQNTREDGHQGLAPVGCYAANSFKLFDMVGNAWEQTKDAYTANHLSRPVASVASDKPMVIKGGSHLCGRNFCVRYRPSAREAHEANLPVSHIGFRTVSRDAETVLPVNFEAW